MRNVLLIVLSQLTHAQKKEEKKETIAPLYLNMEVKVRKRVEQEPRELIVI